MICSKQIISVTADLTSGSESDTELWGSKKTDSNDGDDTDLTVTQCGIMSGITRCINN